MKPKNICRNLFVLAIFAVVIAFCFQFNIAAQENKDTKKSTEAEKTTVPGKDKSDLSDSGWKVKDFKPYIKAIRDLDRLNKEYSENMLKMSSDQYATGLDIIEDMENEIVKMIKISKNKKYLNERWHWQEIDRKNQERRVIAKKKHEAKMKAVTYFTKAINSLDNIQSIDVRKDPKFLNFQTRLYQVYVSTQYDLRNFMPCIPILERYIAISEKNKKDVWAYKYMASCYGYMEAILMKYKHSSEDQIMRYRNKKNRSLLQAVELKYGVSSPHFKHLQELIELDEKKSERINDYK